jgi:hypothetical protein
MILPAGGLCPQGMLEKEQILMGLPSDAPVSALARKKNTGKHLHSLQLLDIMFSYQPYK